MKYDNAKENTILRTDIDNIEDFLTYRNCPVKNALRKFGAVTKQTISIEKENMVSDIKDSTSFDEIQRLMNYCPVLGRLDCDDVSYETLINIANILKTLGFYKEDYLKATEECFLSKNWIENAWDIVDDFPKCMTCNARCHIEVDNTVAD